MILKRLNLTFWLNRFTKTIKPLSHFDKGSIMENGNSLSMKMMTTSLANF